MHRAWSFSHIHGRVHHCRIASDPRDAFGQSITQCARQVPERRSAWALGLRRRETTSRLFPHRLSGPDDEFKLAPLIG